MNDQPTSATASSTPMLGKLTNVDAREIWPHEAVHFTPWLAQAENLAMLADILGLGPLAVEGVEVSVGKFFIDILAKDGAGEFVVIENQFGSTDHKHLGQTITYLAGQGGPVTAIWIAERVCEEHRAAIDWLNANTPKTARFFAVELEVLKIGNSLPAPWFNVVAKPNGWSKEVKQATKLATDTPLDEGQAFNVEYWQAFADFLVQKGSGGFKFSLPNKQRYAYCAVIPPVLWTSAYIKPKGGKDTVGLKVDVSFAGDNPMEVFQKLKADREAIEAAFGEALEWDEMPHAKGAKIVVTTWGFDCLDKTTWPEQFAWLRARLMKFREVFVPRLTALDTPKSTGD